MAQRHILIDPTQPPPPKQSKPSPTTNWEVCVLCQEETDEPLQCPLRSTKSSHGSGYTSLAEDLHLFQGLQHMPLNLNLERLDEGDGVEATLRIHGAQWHKKCRLRFNKKMFHQQSRAEAATVQQSSTSVHTRSVYKCPKSTEPICFFCNEPAGSVGLHEAATKQIDKKVRKHAHELEDTALLAKLAAGDMIAIDAKYHKNYLSTF